MLTDHGRKQNLWLKHRTLSVLGACLWALSGCAEPEIRVYEVERRAGGGPVSSPAEASGVSTGIGASATDRGDEGLSLDIPDHWEAQPLTQFRAASFRPTGDRRDLVDVSVSVLADTGGDDLSNVNRWRQQLDLPPLDAASGQLERDRRMVPSEVGELALYDYTSERNLFRGESPMRLAVAIYRDADASQSWFLRISGHAEAVEEEWEPFLAMVRSFAGGVEPASASASPAPATPPPPPASPGQMGGAGGVRYQVPEGWEELPSDGIRVASFRTPGDFEDGGIRANLFRLPNPAGNLLDNVNRWRAELGLEPVAEAGLDAVVHPMTLRGRQVIFVDLTGESGDPRPRILASVEDRGRQTWFLKMEGSAAGVQANLQSFIDFLSHLELP